MATLANSLTRLADAKHELERAEDALFAAEDKVSSIKMEINNIRANIETLSLPTGLYFGGYKLQKNEDRFILYKRNEEIMSFSYVPSLSELRELEVSLL